MNSPAAIYAFRSLIRESFSQAMAGRIFWFMLIVSGLVILFCLSVSIEGGEPLVAPDDIELRPERGQMSVAFGAFRTALFRDGETQVHFLQLLLAEWVAGAGGILLALIWTAGFLPDFLQPASASVLLAKPMPRWALLVGKIFGVLAFVALQVIIFFLGTWLALGLKTGFWVSSYLWGIPVLLIHFIACYSFSVWLAVMTRNTTVCVIGSLLFWFACWGMNFGRHFVVALPELDPSVAPLPGLFRGLVEGSYWLLPKPVDFGMVLQQVLAAGNAFGTFPELETVQRIGQFHPGLSILTSLGFAAAAVTIAARQLAVTDY